MTTPMATAAPAPSEPTTTEPSGLDSVGASQRAGGVDYAALWRQVEAESARVVVVDLHRKSIVAGRAMSHSGDSVSRLPADAALERFFPGATAQIDRWMAALAESDAARAPAADTADRAAMADKAATAARRRPPEQRSGPHRSQDSAQDSGPDSGPRNGGPASVSPHSELPSGFGSEGSEMLTHSLSPRQWTYFWRLNGDAALVALVHHRYGRGAIAAGDMATIRLLCEHWLAPELQVMGIGRSAESPWNRVERRARAAAPRELWGALAALVLCALCGVWLLLSTPDAPAPAHASAPASAPAASTPAPSPAAGMQRELDRLARLSDETLQRSVALAMASRDYGEVQETLAAHRSLGHFISAVVLNERKLVVAHEGLSPAPVVGQPLATPPGSKTRRLELKVADATLGELYMESAARAEAGASSAPADVAAAAAEAAGLPAHRWAGGLLALAAALSGALLWRHLRRRYR